MSPKDLPSDPHTLKRALGLGTGVAVVVGSVIGSGIFFKPGKIAAESGDFTVIIAVWVFGGVLCLLGAFCFAELATMFPQAGGLYVYLRETYGRLTAFLFGWNEFLFAKPAAIGALSVAFTNKCETLVGMPLSTTTRVLLAIILIVSLSGVNILGVVWGGGVQSVMTIIKAGLVVAVAALPFLLMPFLDQTIVWDNYTSTAPPAQVGLAAQVAAVLLAVMWAYHGWHGITPLTEEIRDPQRNVPRALILGILILIVLYVSANVAYHGVLTMTELQHAGTEGAELMLKKLLGKTGESAMALIIMCSTFGAINSNILETPRISFAMGRDGVFFRALGQVHAEYRTPAAATVVTALMSLGLILAAAFAKYLVFGVDASAIEWRLGRDIIAGLQTNSIFDLLTNFVVFTSGLFYVLAVLAVFILRWRRPDAPRPYRTWGYPFVPIAFLAVYLWFLTRIYGTNPVEAHVGLLLIALGIPAFYAYRRWTTWSVE